MNKKFPLIVKHGNVSVKIYRQQNTRGYTTFTVAHYETDGCLKRSSFASLGKATEHAHAAAERLNRGEGATLVLQGEERLVYTRACSALASQNVSLDIAADDYAQAASLLQGKATLLEAVRLFLNRQGDRVTPRRVQDVVDELIVTREKDRSSVRHIKDLRSRLDRFGRSFQCEIASVAAADIQDFLLQLKLAPKTINNFRTAISNLFTFARMKRYVARDHKPLEEVPEIKEPEREVGIYTSAELQLLIRHASEKFLAYVVIAAFAGLRQSEVGRLEWSHIGDDYIRVPGGERRTKSKRLVKIQPNLKKWLTVVRQPAGRVVPYSNISNEVMDLSKAAGVPTKHNGLRHSYGSYRIAILQDPAKVAYEMGNSVRMVTKHYEELVPVEQANAWFNIEPEQPRNLIALAAVATAEPEKEVGAGPTAALTSPGAA